MLYVLFGGSLALLIILTVTAAYYVLQKKDDSEDYPKIHRSGAFSIVRQAPTDVLKTKELNRDEIVQVLKQNETIEDAESKADEYLQRWNAILKDSIKCIETGDREGVQTYGYTSPEKNQPCSHFGENVYVTREQLQNHVELIPPFHLGCEVRLKHKNAWDTHLDGTGWKALLPEHGKYRVPDWREVAA